MSASASSSVISRDNQDIEGELDQEYGLIQEFKYGVIQEVESEVGAARTQVQNNQGTNQNISPSGLVIEIDPRFMIDIKSERKEDQVADSSDSTSAITRGNLAFEM